MHESASKNSATTQSYSLDNAWAARVRLAQRKKLKWSDDRWQAAFMALGDGELQAANTTIDGKFAPVCLLSCTHGETFILTSSGVERSKSDWRDPKFVPVRPWIVTADAREDAATLRFELLQNSPVFNVDFVLAGTHSLSSKTSSVVLEDKLWVFTPEDRDVLEHVERWPDDFPSRACFFDWLHESVGPKLDFGRLIECAQSTHEGRTFLSSDEDWAAFIKVFADISVCNVSQDACTKEYPANVVRWLAESCSMRRGNNALYAKTFFSCVAVREKVSTSDPFPQFVAAWLAGDVPSLTMYNPLNKQHEKLSFFLALWDPHPPTASVENWMLLDLQGCTDKSDFHQWAHLSHRMLANGSALTSSWLAITSRLCGGGSVTELPVPWARAWALDYADPRGRSRVPADLLAGTLQAALAEWDGPTAQRVYARLLRLSPSVCISGLLPESRGAVDSPMAVCMHYWPSDKTSWFVAQALGDGVDEWCSALSGPAVPVESCELPSEIEIGP